MFRVTLKWLFNYGGQLLEMVCEDYGGRVELAKAYFKALTSSVRNHLKGNGVIASMEHCNDFMFLGTQAISLGRVGTLLSPFSFIYFLLT